MTYQFARFGSEVDPVRHWCGIMLLHRRADKSTLGQRATQSYAVFLAFLLTVR